MFEMFEQMLQYFREWCAITEQPGTQKNWFWLFGMDDIAFASWTWKTEKEHTEWLLDHI